MHHSVLIDEM